ncbi:Flp family type IVb pilin [Vibrio hippocampi]|uniref:Flp family type IVb pilin n=1 Tax=Vibrio hippocampi TaxID=654686 RepID=A0ABM8ZLT4_9VIBR|nr:Flp family type IVb pilin [Vibrio hippocampi]CAH0529489.1 hypothetical protein VHP8226_03245 [Vibrio hippocampi]
MITRLLVVSAKTVRNLRGDERGVTAIEYGLIAVAMAVVLGVALGSDGFLGQLSTAFSTVSTEISNVNTSATGGGGGGEVVPEE